MTFTTHPALARAIAARGYETATAVQQAVLDADTANRDLIVSAQTGSGKTVAFGMGFATTLLGSEERFALAGEPLALVIAPTRELAMQVQRELAWLYAETGARIVTCVGGMDARAEARLLDIGAHIVVGTPGRLRDHLERRRLDLSKLRSVVLDEADEMLDMGFREDLEFILDATPESRQTLLFSATMPREIEALAKRYQRDAMRIQTARRDEQHADIEYQAIRVAPQDVENGVVNVLRFHEAPAAIVFCSTREAVKRMHARLLERGFSAVALSGELTQNERTHALQALRDGRARVLVATDVAARGLDLPDLGLVIHAELPHDHETLVHRSGRTGRAGKKGLCVLVVSFNRRRKAEALIGAARLKVHWVPAPSPDDIRGRDRARFLADPIFTETPAEEDSALARLLQDSKTPAEIALALARMHRASQPAPEDLTPDTGPPRRAERPHGAREDRGRWPRDGRQIQGGTERPPHRRRFEGADNRDMVWFRLNIGRERNADPRWLLPLICTQGGISKAEIGAIKIYDRDTRFQVAAEVADAFAQHVRTNPSKEGHISRVGEEPAAWAPRKEAVPRAAETAPQREAAPDPFSAAQNQALRPHRDAPRRDQRPHGKTPHRKGPPHSRTGGDAPQGAASRPASKYSAKKKHRKGQA